MKEIRGKIKLYDGSVVETTIEIEEGNVVIHLPKGTDTINWYHSVTLKCDL